MAAPVQASTLVGPTSTAPTGGSDGSGGGATAGGTGTGTGGTGTGTGTSAGGSGSTGGTGSLGGATIPVGLALRASHSGMCLSVPAGNGNDGAPLTQQPCTGAAEQTWQIQADNGGRSDVNAADGKCLVMSLASNPAAGTQIYQWTCNGQTNQAWLSRTQGAASNLASAFNTGLCLDVNGASTASGTGTVAGACQASASQTFGALAVQSATQ